MFVKIEYCNQKKVMLRY